MRRVGELHEATSVQEHPGYFPAGGDDLFGVLTEPLAGQRRTAAVILAGAGNTGLNRNRFSVRLSRRLAADGYHALRFDYHGVGESTGVLAGMPKIDEPYLTDIEGATRCILEQGIDRFVLIGECLGARTALVHAPSMPGIRAVILNSPPTRDLAMGEEPGTRLALSLSIWDTIRRSIRPRTIRGLLDPMTRRTYGQFVKVRALALLRRARRLLTGQRGVDDQWVSRQFLDPIEQLSRRNVPILFVFGTKDLYYADFLRAMPGRLGKVLKSAPLTEVSVVEGRVHGFIDIEIQDEVLERILEWLDGHPTS